MNPEIEKLVQEWFALDENEATRAEIQKLVDENNEEELRNRLTQRMTFGTAGLRAKMAAGFCYMNDVTVMQTSQGMCDYVESVIANGKEKGIVIGFDGRHNSHQFARIAAAAFLTRGFKVYLYRDMVPTPFVPFAITEMKCAAGIMVTASHNPKADNGYKVYWENGAQIISPIDQGIAERIVVPENLRRWPNLVSFASVESHPLCHNPSDIIDAYYAKTAKLCNTPDANRNAQTKITYTAMHGVGCKWTARAFEVFNLPPFIAVPEQSEPNADFPTVAFPNPEEGKGALALAIKTADAHNSRLILANDPDADRLAVAEKQADGEWRVLNGNEIAALLAHYVFINYKRNNPSADLSKAFMVASTVSSKFLQAMAAKEGFRFYETLTGFKWMGNKVYDCEQKGETFLFAYEVEIGFLIGNMSLDKDGVRTAAVFAEMANHIYAQSPTASLTGHLESLYQQYGYYMMFTRYFFCHDPALMAAIFDRLRTRSTHNGYVDRVGGFTVASVRDLTVGYDNSQPDNKPLLPSSASNYMITLTFDDGSVTTLRGSGTEPKLKYYVEVHDSDKQVAQQKLSALTAAVIAELLEPERNGLIAPKD